MYSHNSSRAMKSFKSPLQSRTVSRLNDEESNSSPMPSPLSVESNHKNINSDSSTCVTPQRVQGVKRFGDPLSNSKKSFRTPFRSPLSCKISRENTELTENPDQELKVLKEKEENLDKKIEFLEAKGFKVDDLQYYIDELHHYNDIKDAAQIVMGRIADIDQVTFKEVHQRYNANDLE